MSVLARRPVPESSGFQTDGLRVWGGGAGEARRVGWAACDPAFVMFSQVSLCLKSAVS